MKITLRQLEYFVALAEARNFGRAAELVHVSQPALSMQIRDMEAVLGAPVVERHPRDVRLTPLGRAILLRAERILAQMRQLEALPRQSGGLSGALQIGVIPTVAPYLLPVVLPLLRGEDLTLDLRVREAQTEQLLADLENGRLDAAVLALPAAGDGFEELPLFQDRFLLAGSAAQIAGLEAQAEDLRPTTLDPDRLLLLEEGHCLADQALEVCAFKRSQTRVDLGASSLATLCGLVAEGFGLTFLPEIACQSETARAPGLALHRFNAPQPARQIGLVRRHSQDSGPWFEVLGKTLRAAGAQLLAQVPQV